MKIMMIRIKKVKSLAIHANYQQSKIAEKSKRRILKKQVDVEKYLSRMYKSTEQNNTKDHLKNQKEVLWSNWMFIKCV